MQPSADGSSLLERLCHVMQQQRVRRVLEDLATVTDCVSQYKDLGLTMHDDGTVT